MRAAFPIVVVVLFSHLACSRAEGRPSTDARPASADAKAPPPKTNSAVKPPGADQTSVKPPVDGGLPQIEPLTEGKRLRITKLEETPPVEITVPPDMRLTMENLEDLAPRALLKGKVGVIEVWTPENEFSGLTDFLNTKTLDHSEVIHTQRLVRGFLAISRVRFKSSPGYDYQVIVSRPDLNVDCLNHFSIQVTDLAQIQKIASICLSLRAATPKN